MPKVLLGDKIDIGNILEGMSKKNVFDSISFGKLREFLEAKKEIWKEPISTAQGLYHQ